MFVSIHNNAAGGTVQNPFAPDSPYDPSAYGIEALYDPRWTGSD